MIDAHKCPPLNHMAKQKLEFQLKALKAASIKINIGSTINSVLGLLLWMEEVDPVALPSYHGFPILSY